LECAVPKSFTLRAADVRAVYRLVGECRELGDDHLRWHRHLFAGLAGLVGGGVAMGGEVAGIRSGRLGVVGPVDWGWENGFDRVGWERGLAEARDFPQMNRLATFTHYCTRTAASDGVCLARTDLIPDCVWDRAWDFRNMVEPAGADHSLYCFRSIPGSGDGYTGVVIARPLRQADFTTRNKAVVQEVMVLVAPLLGGPLARFNEPSPTDLAPLARRVLKCLLEGDTDKQITAQLGLTRHTVNGYAKVIFRHFGVTTRSELLARWVRRGWGSRFDWAD
jgi:DNA-binding CsgD family transcriptional regulator